MATGWGVGAARHAHTRAILPPIFGTEGMPEPGIPGWTEEQHNKLISLIERRKDEILRGILEQGWFGPDHSYDRGR